MYANEIHEQEDAQEQARKRDEKNRAAWEEILNAEDTDVSEGESFYKRVLQFCQNQITRDRFDLLAMTCPEGFDYTNPEWHKGTKEALRAQLMERKRKQLAPYGNLNPKDAVELRNFEVKLHNMTKKELRALRGQIKFRAEIKDAEGAREWLSRYRLLNQQRQFADKNGTLWPRLPQLVVPEGHVQARPLDAFFLYKILDTSGLRKYLSRYGEQQCNERIADTYDSLRGELQ